jgi:hypothetical protein
MGKFSAIFMSLTILFQSLGIEFSDIVKYPTLVKHVICHIEQGDDLSDFMDLHYGSNIKPHQNKHNEHKELPFKHQHTDTHLQLVFIVNTGNIEIKSSENSYQTNNFLYSKSFFNNYTNRFFQPPQK